MLKLFILDVYVSVWWLYKFTINIIFPQFLLMRSSDHFIDQTFTKTLIQPTPVTTCPLWTFLTMTQRKYTTTHDTFGVVKYIIKTF